MSYEQKISRTKPGLIVLVLDDSGSMSDKLAGTSDQRYKWVERYFNIILNLLLSRSTEVKGDGSVIKPRYYVYVITYGTQPQVWAKGEMDIETAVKNFTQAGGSFKLGGRLGGTNAQQALTEAYNYLQKAVKDSKFSDSFPPMVFHLTDGESHTDASGIAQKIMQLSTSDGNALMVNAYIGTKTALNYQSPDDFPGYVDVSEAGRSQDNIRLFNMSSTVPDTIETNLKTEGIFPQLRPGGRLFFDVRTKEMLKHVIQVIGSMGSRMAR